MATERQSDKETSVETKIQVYWWILNLRALSQRGGEIMDPMKHLPARALDVHGDAAGGDTLDKLKGWGVCCLRTGEWSRESWPKFILNNVRVRGVKLEGNCIFSDPIRITDPPLYWPWIRMPIIVRAVPGSGLKHVAVLD